MILLIYFAIWSWIATHHGESLWGNIGEFLKVMKFYEVLIDHDLTWTSEMVTSICSAFSWGFFNWVLIYITINAHILSVHFDILCFDKIYIFTSHHPQSSQCTFPVNFPPKDNYYSKFYHISLVLSVPETHIQYTQ